MSISGDELHDLELDENREIQIGADKDLVLTSGIETVQQSIAITGGDVLRPLIGEPIGGQTFADIEAELESAIDADPQIESVNSVSVDEVNRSTGEVSVTVHTSYNNSFELSLIVQ